MLTRNLKYDADGSILLEIDTVEHGWIPYRLMANDVSEYGSTLHEQVTAGMCGDITPYIASTLISKSDKLAQIDKLTVTTTSNKVFDGDEVSQGRMSRAIVALQAAGIQTTQWKLTDNTVATVTLQELSEALILAGTEQTRIWVL